MKQVQAIFGANLTFATAEERQVFTERLNCIVKPCHTDLRLETLQTVIPALKTLRSEYRYNINAKLEHLFALDINAIFRELNKYEETVEVDKKQTQMGGERHKEVKKLSKKRNIRGYFTKTQETANARMGAYLCIAGDPDMWQNPNYFELVLQDEDTNKCVGVVMLLNIEAADGRKYLWFGPNPFESFLDQVNSQQYYEYMYQTVTNFASANNFDGVVIPAEEGRILGECTNRGGNFPQLIKDSRIRDSHDPSKIITVDFGKKHILGKYNTSPYSYKDGALIWQQ